MKVMNCARSKEVSTLLALPTPIPPLLTPILALPTSILALPTSIATTTHGVAIYGARHMQVVEACMARLQEQALSGGLDSNTNLQLGLAGVAPGPHCGTSSCLC